MTRKKTNKYAFTLCWGASISEVGESSHRNWELSDLTALTNAAPLHGERRNGMKFIMLSDQSLGLAKGRNPNGWE